MFFRYNRSKSIGYKVINNSITAGRTILNNISELFQDEQTVQKIKDKLPKIFLLAEMESQRAGKIDMEVGTLRERILVSLLIYRFGKENVKTEIPITEPEEDVRVFDKPISIKTKTGIGFSGVKIIWTVDAQKAQEFRRKRRYKNA